MRMGEHRPSCRRACSARSVNDHCTTRVPERLAAIQSDTDALGFGMASESKTGALLSILAASKRSGRFLELGTGTGIGTAWLLHGMDAESTLDSVDNNSNVLAIATKHLSVDPRVTFHLADGAAFIEAQQRGRFDFIYADTWPGKFTHLDGRRTTRPRCQL